MKPLIRLFLLGLFMNSPSIPAWCQTYPQGDQNWIKNDSRSDEFNYSSQNGLDAKWTVKNDFDHYGELECYRDREENVSIHNNDTLILRMLKEVYPCSGSECNGTYNYTSGYIESKVPIGYGYYEIKAKLPKGYGLWPAFWLSGGHPDPNGWTNDLSIMEMGGAYMGNPTVLGTIIGSSNTSNCQGNTYGCDFRSTVETPVYGSTVKYFPIPDLSNDYHIYGCEWLPGRVVWYFDYNAIRTINNSIPDVPPVIRECAGDVVPGHDMTLMLNLAIDGYVREDTPFPAEFKIQWFRFYELKKDLINSDLTLLTSIGLTSYASGVRKNITIGNSSSNISMTSGQKVTLRATGDFLIQGEFFVPFGAEFSAIQTPSY